MTIFLDVVKGICGDFNPPAPGSAPLHKRGLGSWKEARALTAEDAEALRGVWMGAQVGDLISPTRNHMGQIVGARLWTMEGVRLAPRADSGLATTGAVLCNYVATNWLQGAQAPACLIIAEGEPDFATCCIVADGMMAKFPGYQYAVMGIYSGAWTREFGARITEAQTIGVVIAADKDTAGEGYAGKIRASIGRDVEVTRWAGSGSKDVNEVALTESGDALVDAIFADIEMPAPPSEDEGRWKWSDAAGWSEDPAWAAAREAEQAWAKAQAIPRERLGDAMLERAKKYAETKLANVAAELSQTKGDRERACKLIAPLASYVAGGVLDKATVEIELEHAYADGEAADVRKDRKALIKSMLKSGKNGTPRTPITLEDIASKLAAEDDERRREEEARKKRQEETKRDTAKESRKNTKNEAEKVDAPSDMGDVSSVENWHEEIDAMGWERSPSEMELANRLLDYLTPPGMPSPVGAEGELWRYSPAKGVWVEVSDAAVAVIMGRWDAAKTADGKAVRINERSLRAARSIAMRLVEDAGFFREVPRGVMLADRFVAVDPIKKTITEQPPSPDHRARHRVEASPTKPSELLRKYLSSAHEGEDAASKVQLMGEVAFAALTGTGTAYKKAVLCYGGKGSGKSQYLHLVQSLVPHSAKISVMPQDMGQDYHCASLAGKTLNLVGELEADEFMKEGKFKSIVHGEAVQARHPSERVFQLWPIALHLFNANALPAAPGVSPAFWDRWIIVGFERGWTDDDRALIVGGVDEIGKQITDTDMGGLLSWVLDCGKGLVERGKYTIPESSRRLMKEWQAEGDTVAGWLDENCEVLARDARQELWEKFTPAYEDYKMYCSTHNHRPVNSRKFRNRLTCCGVRVTRASSGAIYSIRLLVRI